MLTPLALKMIQQFAQKGKSAKTNINILEKALEALGWGVKEDIGIFRINDYFFDNTDTPIAKFISDTGASAQTRGPISYNDDVTFWYDSEKQARAALKKMPRYFTITKSKKAPARPQVGVVYVGSAELAPHPWGDGRGLATIKTHWWNFGLVGYKFTALTGKSAILAPKPYRGRPVDPTQMSIGKFYTWAYKNGLNSDAYEYMEGGGAAEVAEQKLQKQLSMRSLDSTGTCAACGQNVKITRKRQIMRHGWVVQGGGWRSYGGWHSSSCFGTGYPPFELSKGGAVDYRKAVVQSRTLAKNHVRRLKKNNNNKPIPWSRYPGAAVKLVGPEDRRFKSLLARKLEEAEFGVRQMDQLVRTLEAGIAGWSQKPLPGDRTASASRTALRWLTSGGYRGNS